MKAGTLMIKIMLAGKSRTGSKKLGCFTFFFESQLSESWLGQQLAKIAHVSRPEKSRSGYRQSPLKTKYFEGCTVKLFGYVFFLFFISEVEVRHG